MDIGKKLCERRRELGLSQTELAEALKVYGVNVTNQAVSKWENGSTLPSALQFLMLCRALRISDIAGEFMPEGDSMRRGAERRRSTFSSCVTAANTLSARSR